MRLNLDENFISQLVHSNGFFPSCIFAICSFRLPFAVKFLSQIVHWYGFFPSCTLATWFFKICNVVNWASQRGQSKVLLIWVTFFFLDCILHLLLAIWSFRFLSHAKSVLQMWQVLGFVPLLGILKFLITYQTIKLDLKNSTNFLICSGFFYLTNLD